MKRIKNNLDEMQEQSLLKIESHGMWMAYYGLVALILVQAFFGGEQAVHCIAGECILLFILSVYVCAACLRKGIWSRGLKATPKTNAVVSIISGLIVGVFWGVRSYLSYRKIVGSVAVCVCCTVLTFAVTFALMTVCVAAYKKKKQSLECETGPDDIEAD